jgi:hypothetical protein
MRFIAPCCRPFEQGAHQCKVSRLTWCRVVRRVPVVTKCRTFIDQASRSTGVTHSLCVLMLWVPTPEMINSLNLVVRWVSGDRPRQAQKQGLIRIQSSRHDYLTMGMSDAQRAIATDRMAPNGAEATASAGHLHGKTGFRGHQRNMLLACNACPHRTKW